MTWAVSPDGVTVTAWRSEKDRSRLYLAATIWLSVRPSACGGGQAGAGDQLVVGEGRRGGGEGGGDDGGECEGACHGFCPQVCRFMNRPGGVSHVPAAEPARLSGYS